MSVRGTGNQFGARVWSAPGIGMGVILVLLAFLILGIPGVAKPPEIPTEIQMGMIIVIAVGALIILLYLMASGFSGLNLANAQYALGLPEGSIRALIALFMILIFLIGSIYLFRSVSGQPGGSLQNVTLTQVLALGDRVSNVQPNNTTTAGNYDVVLITGVSDAGQKLALQLITVLGTLVAAVSSFYFGSAVATSAQRAAEAAQSDALLSIESITPRSGNSTKGIVDTVIIGNGFVDKTKVKLVHTGVADIDATDIQLVNSTIMKCKFDLTGKTLAKWNLTIEKPDGSQAGKSELFEIM